MPQIARTVLHALRTPAYVPAHLAIAYMRASPGRVAATLAAMVASVSLMVAMAIMVASFRQSLDDWLTVMLPADVYVRAASDSVAFRRATTALRWRGSAVSRAPSSCARHRHGSIRRCRAWHCSRATSTPAMQRRGWRSSATPCARLPVRRRPRGSASRWPMRRGWRPVRSLTLPLAGRAVAFTVAGVWRDYVRQQGAVVIERARYVALTGDDAVNEAALWLAPGVDAAAVRDDVARAAGAAARAQLRRRPICASCRSQRSTARSPSRMRWKRPPC